MAHGSHNKKNVNYGHVNQRCKSLIIAMTMLLLKTTDNKTSFVSFKRTVRADLNLIDPFARDGTNMWGKRNKISRASTIKSSQLLCHRMLPFLMNNITVRGWLSRNNTKKTKSIRRLNRLAIMKRVARRRQRSYCWKKIAHPKVAQHAGCETA